MKEPSRDPGSAIKEALRREVNFGCPVRYSNGSGCGCPILTYHHFDPPWAGNYEHNLDGMIALCHQHHDQADGGHWTKAQLREMKRNPYIDDAIKHPWFWPLETLLIKAGGCLIVGSGSPLRLHGKPVMEVRPHDAEFMGGRILVFESDIVDTTGRSWLKITDGCFDLSIPQTTNLEFTPQLKRFTAKNQDSTFVSLRFKRKKLAEFEAWVRGFAEFDDGKGNKTSRARRFAEQAHQVVTRLNIIDRDGFVPVMEFRGQFQTPELKVEITNKNYRTEFAASVRGGQL